MRGTNYRLIFPKSIDVKKYHIKHDEVGFNIALAIFERKEKFGKETQMSLRLND